jgi:hypothetical protein
MRNAIAVFVAAILGGCQSMPSGDIRSKAELASAAQAWTDALNRCEPARIAGLYDRDAVLWPTTTPTIVSTPEGVRQYFERVCASPARPTVAFGEQLVRVYGDNAINSGSYTFVHHPARWKASTASRALQHGLPPDWQPMAHRGPPLLAEAYAETTALAKSEAPTNSGRDR